MSVIKKAIEYTLCRVRDDRNFSYYMLGTQSMELLCKALAEIEGKDWKEVEAACSRTFKQKPDVEELREKVDMMEILLDDEVAGWRRKLDRMQKQDEQAAQVKAAKAKPSLTVEVDGHVWRAGNSFAVRDDGPGVPDDLELTEITADQVENMLVQMEAANVPYFLQGFDAASNAILRNDTGRKMKISKICWPMLRGYELCMAPNGFAVVGRHHGTKDVLSMVMAYKQNDNMNFDIVYQPSHVRRCQYEEISHLVEASWEEGVVTKDQPGMHWFCYDHETHGPLAIGAVLLTGHEPARLCAAYTARGYRGKGYGKALLGIRMKFALESRNIVEVHSKRPGRYLDMGFVEVGKTASGASRMQNLYVRINMEA